MAERARLDSERARLDAMQTFYHGTSVAAGVAIQAGGFRVDLSGTNAGTTLGDGVYLTGTLAKAMTYATSGSRPLGGCVLVLKVDLGRCKELTHHDPMMRTWHQHTFNSAHAGNGVNGRELEHCVRDPRRITVVNFELGNTAVATRAGYAVQAGTLTLDTAVERRRLEAEAAAAAAAAEAEAEAQRRREQQEREAASRLQQQQLSQQQQQGVQLQTIVVAVPANAGVGTLIQFSHNGKTLQVHVPADARPGQNIQVRLAMLLVLLLLLVVLLLVLLLLLVLTRCPLRPAGAGAGEW